MAHQSTVILNHVSSQHPAQRALYRPAQGRPAREIWLASEAAQYPPLSQEGSGFNVIPRRARPGLVGLGADIDPLPPPPPIAPFHTHRAPDPALRGIAHTPSFLPPEIGALRFASLKPLHRIPEPFEPTGMASLSPHYCMMCRKPQS